MEMQPGQKVECRSQETYVSAEIVKIVENIAHAKLEDGSLVSVPVTDCFPARPFLSPSPSELAPCVEVDYRTLDRLWLAHVKDLPSSGMVRIELHQGDSIATVEISALRLGLEWDSVRGNFFPRRHTHNSGCVVKTEAALGTPVPANNSVPGFSTPMDANPKLGESSTLAPSASTTHPTPTSTALPASGLVTAASDGVNSVPLINSAHSMMTTPVTPSMMTPMTTPQSMVPAVSTPTPSLSTPTSAVEKTYVPDKAHPCLDHKGRPDGWFKGCGYGYAEFRQRMRNGLPLPTPPPKSATSVSSGSRGRGRGRGRAPGRSRGRKRSLDSSESEGSDSHGSADSTDSDGNASDSSSVSSVSSLDSTDSVRAGEKEIVGKSREQHESRPKLVTRTPKIAKASSATGSDTEEDPDHQLQAQPSPSKDEESSPFLATKARSKKEKKGKKRWANLGKRGLQKGAYVKAKISEVLRDGRVRVKFRSKNRTYVGVLKQWDSTVKERKPRKPGKPPRVIVVGAGFAGIAAANELRDRGCRVTVLEARERIGGRCWTNTSFQGLPIELGASWIHGIDGNPLAQLAASNPSLNLVKIPEHCVIFGHDGRAVAPEEDQYVEQVFNKLLEKAKQAAETLNADTGLSIDGISLNEDVSLGETLNELMTDKTDINSQTQSQLFNWHCANIEYSTAADINDLSVRFWAMDDQTAFSGQHCVVSRGFGALASTLASKLDVRLNSAVVRIAYIPPSKPNSRPKRNQVSVTLKSGATLSADAVLVTLPLGVLKASSVEFVPELPAWKTKAIETLGFGTMNKVVLVYEQQFWGHLNTKGKYIGYASNKKGEFYMFIDLSDVYGKPTLMCLLSGKFAHEVEGTMSDAAILARITEILGRIVDKNPPPSVSSVPDSAVLAMSSVPQNGTLQSESCSQLAGDATSSASLAFQQSFPQVPGAADSTAQVPTPVMFHVTRWGSDEFSRGSYSYYRVGSSESDTTQLAKPLDGKQVYFAGEATNLDHPSTVHGAYMSGIREARNIFLDYVGTLPDLDMDSFVLENGEVTAGKWQEGGESPEVLAQLVKEAEKLCAFCGDKSVDGPQGEMLGPLLLSKRQVVFAHENCASCSPEVGNDDGRWYNIAKAIRRGRKFNCTGCGKPGATIGCFDEHCFAEVYHFTCAGETVWDFSAPEEKIFYCESHRDRSAENLALQAQQRHNAPEPEPSQPPAKKRRVGRPLGSKNKPRPANSQPAVHSLADKLQSHARYILAEHKRLNPGVVLSQAETHELLVGRLQVIAKQYMEAEKQGHSAPSTPLGPSATSTPSIQLLQTGLHRPQSSHEMTLNSTPTAAFSNSQPSLFAPQSHSVPRAPQPMVVEGMPNPEDPFSDLMPSTQHEKTEHPQAHAMNVTSGVEGMGQEEDGEDHKKAYGHFASLFEL